MKHPTAFFGPSDLNWLRSPWFGRRTAAGMLTAVFAWSQSCSDASSPAVEPIPPEGASLPIPSSETAVANTTETEPSAESLEDPVSEPQAPAPEADAETVAFLVVEAESGTVGAGATVLTDAADDSIAYVTATTDDVAEPVAADDPRISSLDLNFSQTGSYRVYARFRIGANGADDDSFFIDQSASDQASWAVLNNLTGYSAAGQTGYQPESVVDALGGDSTPGVWKWGRMDDITLEIGETNLSRAFRFAVREDGLDLDKFAFVAIDESTPFGITVDQLEAAALGRPITIREGLPELELPPSELPPSPGGGLAAAQDKFFGGICCGNQRPGLETYFNQITPENAGKWGSVEAVRDQFNWAGLDQAVDVAEENGFLFRFHVLLWGSQQPDWIEDLPPAEQLEEIREWMEAVNERYAGRLDYIEVLNEFDNQPPTQENEGNYLEALGGAGVTGYDWILTGFRMAREVFGPEAQLVLNEYSVVNSNARTDRYLQVVELLQAEGLIDALGFQGHAFSTRGDVNQMVANVNRLGATGLPVMVTELDIDGPELTQLIDYQRIFPAFWENDNIVGVTLWGHRDGHWRQAQGATLVTSDEVEKPALRWLKGYVGGTAPRVSGNSNVSLNSNSPVGTEVLTLSASGSDEQPLAPTATVQWGIAEADEAIGQAVAFAADGSGRLETTGPVAPGTYSLRVYVDADAIVSNLFDLEVTVQ